MRLPSIFGFFHGTAAPAASETPVHLTPLGGPMDEESAFLQAANPLAWNLQYWLNIAVVGSTWRDEDTILMAFRVEMEHDKIPDPAFKLQLKNAWSQYQKDNQDECMQKWQQTTPESWQEAQPYLYDLDIMLADKERKTRKYISRMADEVIRELKAGNSATATNNLEKIFRVRQRMQREKRRADAMNARLSHRNGAYYQEG